MNSFKYLLIIFFLSSLFAQDSTQSVIIKNINPTLPFILENNRIVPGKKLQFSVDKNDFDYNKQKIYSVELSYTYPSSTEKNVLLHNTLTINNYYFKTFDSDVYLYIPVPNWNRLKYLKSQNGFKGYFKTYDANLIIKYQGQSADQLQRVASFEIKLPDPIWAFIWGILILIMVFVIIAILKPQAVVQEKEGVFEKDESLEKWKEVNPFARFLLYPLNFAVTPLNRYSISLVQILFWTFVTIFGLVYVHRISEEFLAITPQVLTLLGIGGGTALAAKIHAQDKIVDLPSYYLQFIKRDRIPKLRDIISINGQPNIFKMQMLAFTIITGCFVVVDIVKNYAFPKIPPNLIILMGISTVIYLGNEVSIESIWKKIKSLKKEIDDNPNFKNLKPKTKEEIKKLKESDKDFEKLFDDMIQSIEKIYI